MVVPSTGFDGSTFGVAPISARLEPSFENWTGVIAAMP
jgi:hypothetical protein